MYTDAGFAGFSLKSQAGVLILWAGSQIPFNRDNRSTLSIARLGGTWRSRHYALRAQAARELIAMENITLDYVPSEEQVAEVLTKALPIPLVSTFSKSSCVCQRRMFGTQVDMHGQCLSPHVVASKILGGPANHSPHDITAPRVESA